MRRLALAAVVTIAALVGAEYGIRLVAPRLWMVWDPHQHRVFRPDPQIMPGIHGESHFLTDRFGYRSDGVPPGTDLRVLTLGGSTTECLYLDQTETWPHLLQDRLQSRTGRTAWVANGGKSGLNTYHHVVQAERLLFQRSGFDVVVLMVGLNDMHQRMRKGADAEAYDAWHSSRPVEIEARALAVRPDPYSWREFPRNAALSDLITDAWRTLDTRRQSDADDTRIEDDHGRSYVSRREMRARADVWIDTPPDLSHSLDRYAANLERVLDLVYSAGATALIATQPSMWADVMDPDAERLLWFGWFEDEPWVPRGYYTGKAMRTAMDMYNSTTLRVAGSKGVPTLDLARELTPSSRFFYDDCHFSELGARRAAVAIAEALEATGPFSPRSIATSR